MSIVISIFAALLVLGILVTVHEGGHFLMGKWLGFKILEFSVGMGPKVFSKEKNGTVYSLRAFPIGGMCAFDGEDEDTKKAGTFNSFPAWKRFLVAFAGPFMNIVLAFVMAIILMLIFGQYESVNLQNPQIASFAENAPAQNCGLQEGDIIKGVNGMPVTSTDEMIKAIRADEDGDIDITLLRPTENSKVIINGIEYTGEEMSEFVKKNPAKRYIVEVTETEEFNITVKDTYNEKEKCNMIGATISESIGGFDRHYNVFSAIPAGCKFVKNVMKQMYEFLGSIFKGSVSAKDVSGIVGVVDVVNDGVGTVIDAPDYKTGQKVSMICEFIMYLAVLLSINLGIINLLPLPALDGGRILFNIIEIVVGKPVPMKVEGMIHTVGLILLLVLIAVITVKDVVFLFI